MEELIIPNPSQHDVNSYDIFLDGTVMDASYEVISISMDKEINRIPSAKIVLKDGDASLATFEISNKADFIPGKSIVIHIGFDGDNKQVFKGIIIKHTVKVKENGNTQLLVECRDDAILMTISRHSRYFLEVKDQDVFDSLIAGYKKLTGDTAATSLLHKELIQHQLSDWDFMLLRAEANGMLVNVDDGKVQIGKPDTTADPVLQVAYGSSIIEFEAEMDVRNQWASVNAVSWDYTNQALFTAETADAADFLAQGNISGNDLAAAVQPAQSHLGHSGHLPEQELQDWTDGMMLRSRMAKIRGRVRVTGFTGIKPGDMLKISGAGDRFNGNSYVTAVKQDLGDGTWYTNIQFGLDPESYITAHKAVNDPPAGGLLGAIHGLQIGIVVQLENDPDGEDRIRVKIPVIDNQSDGTWVRVASLDAGTNRGAFFMPEIGDEVIVGFINDDPRHAIMLGMLHSSSKEAPLSAQDANNEKGFFTRSKMRIHFNDDSKTITIDTPAGNSIQLDEQGTKIEIKDQNSNKITLSSSGIKMESTMDIEISAGANLTLKAGASLKVGGMSLAVEASGELGLKGASAKLESSGITMINGSMVKIN